LRPILRRCPRSRCVALREAYWPRKPPPPCTRHDRMEIHRAACRRRGHPASAPEWFCGRASPDQTASSGCEVGPLRQAPSEECGHLRVAPLHSCPENRANQPTASADRICSSAPQVRTSAARSARGPVWAEIIFATERSARVGRTVIGVMTIHFSAVARPDEITDARLFCSWRSQADQSEPFFPALINSARRSNVRDKAGSTP
jgi:hypothetical protein